MSETEDQRRTRQQREAERSREARKAESEEQRRTRQQRDAERSIEARQSESIEQRDSRTGRDRQATQAARQVESEEQRTSRRERDRERRQRDRHNTRALRSVTAGINTSEIKAVDIGDMNYECRFCKALHFKDERKAGSSASNPLFTTCCQGGNLTSEQILLLPDPPELLCSLMTGSTPQCKSFQKDIIKYNNALCMAFVHAKWVNRGEGRSSFNPTMTVQGRIHHFLGGAQPVPGRNPAFLSVYFFDTEHENMSDLRMRNVAGVDRQFLTRLSQMLHGHNGYVRSFMSLRDWASSESAMSHYRIVIHADKRPSNEHVIRYNGPSSSKMAALIPGNEDGLVGKRDIVVRKRGSLNSNGNEVLDKVSVSHRSYDPLAHVPLFPHGTNGWHFEMNFQAERSQRKLTPLMFYRWRLFQRSGEFNTVLYGYRLLQQYIVDQYSKIESERLSCIAHNQRKMRAENCTTLREQLRDTGGHEDESEAVKSGRLVVLPSTYVGGDRYMRQKVHDIIATSNKLGHPDIFLTMTCNPNWPEISRSLLAGQTPKDRPDLCASVFRLKLKALMEFVLQKELFGKLCHTFGSLSFRRDAFHMLVAYLFLIRLGKIDFATQKPWTVL